MGVKRLGKIKIHEIAKLLGLGSTRRKWQGKS